MNFYLNKVAIIGMGFMGGSLGRALIKKNIAKDVIGIGRNFVRLKSALRYKAATEITTDLKKGVKDADLIVICLPVSLIPIYFNKIIKYLKKECCVTDIGSIKEKIIKEIQKKDKKKIFIGSHPMVGSEKAGIENIKDDLYENGVCIITPDKNSSEDKKLFIKRFWEKVGMKVFVMSPFEHDRCVAGISHFPHLLAFLLVKMQKENILKRKEIIGKGFKDTTRIAGSNEKIWADIFIDNKENLLKEIKEFKKELNKFESFLKDENKKTIIKIIKKAKILREKLL